MLSPKVKLFGAAVTVVLVCCLSTTRANASVFRDRAAFNAASQNLRTIDFESVPQADAVPPVDGVVFESIGGSGIGTNAQGNKYLSANSVGEITRLIIFLPPGTTAVGCDQFSRPMIIATSTGESVSMELADGSNFVGFVSDQPIQTLTISLDFPEPTPPAFVDDLSFGQRRAGNEPPVPQLLTTTGTGRAIALDSVTNESEPLRVLSTRNFATDGHTRITLFVVGVALEPADLPFVKVQAEDQQHHLFDLPCEATARVTNLSWMSQVTVLLPDALAAAGDVNITVTVRGAVSNMAPVRID
jgi:hypothetical protein